MIENSSDAPQPSPFDRLIASPFAKVKALLDGIVPAFAPIDMTIGEPRHKMPDCLAGALQESFSGYGKYPPIQGTTELTVAIGNWIEQRYPVLKGAIDTTRHILPLSGSREGLFSAVFPALARRADLARPAVLMPNPFYQAYLAAALAVRAEPIFLTASEGNGFLPNLDDIPLDVLNRTAAFYLASPSNPQGAVAEPHYLAKAIGLARRHDFLLFLDECYSEIYVRASPPGGLETAFGLDKGFSHVLTFNSLSKRSNVPGLRSGFIAGDEAFLASFSRFRNVAAPQMPLPVQHASAVLWSDESHVEASRLLYVTKIEAARALLGGLLEFTDPDGAFFLWPKVTHLGGGEAAAKTFWKECGVKVLPGAYLAQADSIGRNPGADFVRMALIDDPALTRQALKRLASFLS